MRVALLASLVAGSADVTINVQLPQQKLDRAAYSIADFVSGTPAPSPNAGMPAPPSDTATGPKPPSGSRQRGESAGARATWLRWLSPTEAHAQAVPQLKVLTPEVKAAIESRRRRNAAVDAAERAGCLGENLQGLVEARPGVSCPPDVGALAAAESADRMVIYRTLVEQNNKTYVEFYDSPRSSRAIAHPAIPSGEFMTRVQKAFCPGPAGPGSGRDLGPAGRGAVDTEVAPQCENGHRHVVVKRHRCTATQGALRGADAGG